jgi:sugar fermentation stimulation protein A
MGTETKKGKEYQGLAWPELVTGRLIQRYKRFLADVELADGRVVTAHCPNSGSMTACSEPGRPVYLSRHDDPKRKLKYTWEIIRMPDSLVGVNTLVPNRLVKTSIENGMVPELADYEGIRSEVQTSAGSRIDLLLTGSRGAKCFVEIKNCTLVNRGTASFPDAVTQRGRRHLKELERLTAAGNRCVMFYCIQRMDAERFTPADRIDAAYGEALRAAHVQGGVEILVYDVWMDLNRIVLNRKIPIVGI